jgi:hypothetical protein
MIPHQPINYKKKTSNKITQIPYNQKVKFFDTKVAMPRLFHCATILRITKRPFIFMLVFLREKMLIYRAFLI